MDQVNTKTHQRVKILKQRQQSDITPTKIKEEKRHFTIRNMRMRSSM